MELRIGKWGNSLGVRLPKNVLHILDIKSDDRMNCVVKEGKIILEPVRRRKPSLEELLDKVEDPGEEISWGKPEGGEVW